VLILAGVKETIVAKQSGSNRSRRTHRRRSAQDEQKPSKSPAGHADRRVRKRTGGAEAESNKRRNHRLSAEELEQFRQLLLAKRQEIVGNVTDLQDEALGKTRSEAAGDLSQMPIHMADIGSDNYERDFALDLLDNERNLLREIDEALQRIESGTYGICVATGKPITKARLKFKPWAKYCLEYARTQEKNNLH